MNRSISSLIAAADAGDRDAAKALFAALYVELRRVARRQLARRGVNLSTTTLLHEAYLQMVARAGTAFADRARFLGYAARVMRGLVIDCARRRKALKRGGLFEITKYEDESVATPTVVELSRIGAALDQLAADEPLLAQLVDLKFFCGFTFEEIAAMQEVSARTIRRRWEKARIYLHDLVTDE